MTQQPAQLGPKRRKTKPKIGQKNESLRGNPILNLCSTKTYIYNYDTPNELFPPKENNKI